jgi:RNA polymerase primary sigma factor
MTRAIAELEDEVWRVVLQNPSRVKYIVEKIKAAPSYGRYASQQKKLGALLTKICRLSEQSGKKKATKEYSECAEELIWHLRGADLDRELVRGAVNEAVFRNALRKSNGKRLRTAHARRVESVFKRLTSARDVFIEANQGLVVLIAGRYTWTRMSFSDLVQEGNLGLIRALNRFDFEKGYQFSTYASWWIQSAIGRAIDNKETIIRVPSSAMRNRSRLKKVVSSIRLQKGRNPTEEEILEETGMGRLRLARAQRNAVLRVFSLDQEVSEFNNLRYVDVLTDDDSANPFEETVVGALTREVGHHLRDLTPLERSILKTRFGLDNSDELTLQEIADQYGLSRERIRQIQNRALDKLREKLALDAA